MFIEEVSVFQAQAPIAIVPLAEARAALGAQPRPAALAAWRELARRGEGREMAHCQIVHIGVTLGVASHPRLDGYIETGTRRVARRVLAEERTCCAGEPASPPPRSAQ